MTHDHGSGLSEALAAAVETAAGSVVRVEGGRRRGASSGIVLDPGVIVAAHHALERGDGIEIGLPGGGTAPAELAGRDPATDLAVLRSGAEGLRPAAWSDGVGLKVGHLVLAVTRPGKTARAALGIVGALGGEWRTTAGGRVERYIETDVSRIAGFSGGALVDLEGRVLGLNTSALVRGSSVALPAAAVRRAAEAILSGRSSARGYLGVGTFPVRLPEPSAAMAGQEAGLLVVSVQPGSPAEKAGLLLGDVLLGAGGRAVSGAGDLFDLLDPETVGTEMVCRILRAGEVREVKVTVGARDRVGC
jgi:S1-C subfamily serine protease